MLSGHTLQRCHNTEHPPHKHSLHLPDHQPDPWRSSTVLCKQAAGSSPVEAFYFYSCTNIVVVSPFPAITDYMLISCSYSCVCPAVQSSDGRVGGSRSLSRQGSEIPDHPCFSSLGWAGPEECTNQRTCSPCLPQSQVHTARV